MVNEIIKKINEYAITKSEALACCFKDKSISYFDFNDNVNRLSAGIAEVIHNEQQAPIIIYHSRGIEFIQYMIAVLKCGCFYVPIEDVVPLERVKYIYDDIKAKLIITDKDLDLDSHYRIADSRKNTNTIITWRDEMQICSSDLIYTMYTSGTSGNPKGVKIMYSNLLNLLESFGEIIYKRYEGLTVGVGVLASFSFDASVKQIYSALYYGHTLYIADEKDRLFSRKLHNFHIKNNLIICDATPSHIRLMMMQKQKQLSHIPYILVGGEVLRWSVVRKYYDFIKHQDTTMINVYGPTECCVDVSYKVIDYEESRKHVEGVVPIGRPLRNTKFFIVDDMGNEVSMINVKGELVITGKQVGAGYINVESRAFSDGLYGKEYRTGDVAYINDENEVVVEGRKDSQVKVNGYRIELEEIQQIAEKIVQAECVVFCFNEEDYTNKKIALYICKELFSKKDIDELKIRLRSLLPCYMLPSYYFAGKDIPLTQNGKQDKRKLQKILFDRSEEIKKVRSRENALPK